MQDEPLVLLVDRLAEARRLAAYATDRRQDAVAQVKFNFPHLFTDEVEANAALSALEKQVRERALLATDDGEALPPGVTTRWETSYTYDDAEALKWALEHKMCLTIDRKAFAAICKASTPAFVTIDRTLSARVAQDLDPLYPPQPKDTP